MANATCLLLEKIPAEICNEIYEYSFALDREGEVNLQHTTPPGKALLIACGQINAEARKLRKLAYQRYWKETPFVLPRCGAATAAWTTNQLKSEDIEHNQHLTIHARESSHIVRYKLHDPRGAWHTIDKDGQVGGYLTMMTPTTDYCEYAGRPPCSIAGLGESLRGSGDAIFGARGSDYGTLEGRVRLVDWRTKSWVVSRALSLSEMVDKSSAVHHLIARMAV